MDGSILVVEDDRAMLHAISAGLLARGFDVHVATTGREALDRANAERPDVVLLDLGLPDLDGVDVCRHLRRWMRAPIIVLTADGAEDRKVTALDSGADDYVTKPFSMPELHARVRVAIRHQLALAAIVEDEVLTIGSLQLDVAGHDATIDGASIELTRREFALLTELARNCGKVLTTRHLLTRVWGPEWVDSPATLRTHLSTLRKKLGSGDGAPTIATDSGVGYRMLQPE